MYARNNPSPKPFTIGTITKISDGVVQTTGVSVKTSKDGAAYGTGGGSLSVEDGEWSYLPTQAETDCESLRIVIAKTDCYSRSITVVFTASNSFGYAGTDQSKIANPTATVGLTNTTIKAASDNATLTQIEGSTVLAKDSTVAKDATVAKDSTVAKDATVAKEATLANRPTLAQIENSTVLAKDSTVAKDATVAKEATLAGKASQASVDTLASYVDTEVPAIKAKTDNLPAQPAAVGDIPTANQNRDAVMNAMPSGGWDNGSFGDRWVVSNNSNRTIGVTGSGSGHVHCAVHAMQTDVITAASVSAAAVTKIQTGLASQTSVDTLTTYVDTEVLAIKVKTDNLPVDPADASDIAASFASLTSQINVLASYVDTEVLAIKAKTDNLPSQPAAVGDIPTAASNATAVWSFALASIDTAGSAAKILTDAGTGIATLVTRITSAVYNTFVDLAQMIVNDGTASAQWSATAMANIPVAGGSGARTVTITVRDPSAVAIQNATVRISRTGESFALQTNASGVVVFSLDDATWTVAITATGFSFSPVTLAVSANVSQTYTMTAAGGGVTPSEPPFCTGFWTVYGVNGTIQAGAQVSIQASSPPAGSTGIVMEDAVRTATADNNGVVQFSNLIKGSTYIVYRAGSSRKFNVVVPASAGNTVALGSIVG